MEVAAVSWGQPQWIEINGVKTRTSIIHTISESITLRTGGDIEGNNTAVHDAPVYAFFAHHYDYWREKLNVPQNEWNWCHWGENITFRTDYYMDEYNFNLGDVWKVGDEVVLQVCGARVPCFKLAWRCGQKDKWLKELADTGFSGVYLRILQGGTIRPGDRAELTLKREHTANVAQITQLAFDNRLETKDTLNLIVKEPDLLSMNKGAFLRKLSKMHDDELVGKNSWKGWRTFRVTKIVPECEDVKSFYLEPTDKNPLATYLPGQFLTVRLPNGLARNWSISDWPDHDDPPHYRLSIKNAGEASSWMHTKCTPGTKLFLRAPAGRFVLDWSPMFPLRQLYLSAGVGITPVVAMLKAHLQHYTMRRAPAVWIHVAQDESRFPEKLLREVLELYDEELRKDDILKVYVFYTKSTTANFPPISDLPSDDGLSPAEDLLTLQLITKLKVNTAADVPAEAHVAGASPSLASSVASSSQDESTTDATSSSDVASSNDDGISTGATSASGKPSAEEAVPKDKETVRGELVQYNGDPKIIHNRRPDHQFLSEILSSSYYFDPMKITPIEVPGPQATTVYICGSSSFEADMRSHLQAIGVPGPSVKSESFSLSGNAETATTTIQKSSIAFTLSKITANWAAAEAENPSARSMTLLEFAESLGLEPNFGCRAGQCGACRVPLLKGAVEGGLQPDGSVLMCQSRPGCDYIEMEL